MPPWVMIERDGRGVRQPVRVGVRGDRKVEVLDGLTDASRVLSAQVEPGSQVPMESISRDASGVSVAPVH